MFSGKSEELIRRLRRAEIAGQRALIVKPTIDNRYDVGHVVSHAGARMRAVTATTGGEVLRLANGYDAVGIDEVQFFDDGIVDAITALVEGGGRVVAAGLAQDFRGLPFGAMPTLLCLAEFVDKLEAVCHRCGGPATMTQRLVDGEPAPFDGQTIQVGALDSYEARCRSCHELGRESSLVRGTRRHS
jgi:thymidine kinase